MIDTQLTCQGCGAQFKTKEELQKHEKECAAAKHLQRGQPEVNQPKTQNQGNPQEGRTQTGSGQNQPPKNQPEKTRTAGGGSGSNQESK